jgi:hypothetical protein
MYYYFQALLPSSQCCAGQWLCLELATYEVIKSIKILTFMVDTD